MFSLAHPRVFVVAALLGLGCGATAIVSDESSPEGTDLGPMAIAPPERPARAAADVDVVGTWYACGGTVEFADNGTWSMEGYNGCRGMGRWTIAGHRLNWTATSSDCDYPVAVGDTQVVRSDNALMLHHPEYARGTLMLLDENTPRSAWELTGTIDDLGTTGTSIVRVVGSPRHGYGSACYLSEDGDCGGLISCGGWVEIWNVAQGYFTAKTSCGGPCPCGAVLSGTPQPDGTIVGSYNAANCGRRFGGEFTLTPLSD